MKFELLGKEYDGILIGGTRHYDQAHQYWVLSPKDKTDLQNYGKILVFDQVQESVDILSKPVSVEIQKTFIGNGSEIGFFPSEIFRRDFDKINALLEYLDGIYWIKESYKIIEDKRSSSKEAAFAALTTAKQFWENIQELMKEETKC